MAYSYDALGRKVGEYAGSAAGTALARWSYDTLQAGQLTSSTRYTTNGNYVVAANGYDSAANPTGTTTTLPATAADFGGVLNADATRSYSTAVTWTSTHLMATQVPFTSASGIMPAETVRHYYDSHGDATVTTGYNAYVSGSSYSPYGEANQYTLGTNNQTAWMTYTRDPQTRRIIATNLSALNANPQIENTAYTYDPAGNITASVDTEGIAGAPTEKQCYTYDTLDQLTQAWSATNNCAAGASPATVGGPQAYFTSWAFDAAGNRTQQIQHALSGSTAGDVSTTYTTGLVAHAHALSATTTSGTGIATSQTSYTYNADGSTHTRTLPGGTQTVTYTPQGRTSGITTPAGTVGYTYTADDVQLIRTDPSTTTLYLPGEELARNNTTGAVSGTRSYTHNGAVVSERINFGNQIFLYADPNSTNQVAVPTSTTGTGTPIRRYLDPYGNQYNATTGSPWPDQHGFLNKPTDTATALTDLGARQYDPTLGRFLTVDPVLDPGNPQQNNGYSYGWNNPISRSDPTGLDPHDSSCDGLMGGASLACHNNSYSGTAGAASNGQDVNCSPYCGRDTSPPAPGNGGANSGAPQEMIPGRPSVPTVIKRQASVQPRASAPTKCVQRGSGKAAGEFADSCHNAGGSQVGNGPGTGLCVGGNAAIGTDVNGVFCGFTTRNGDEVVTFTAGGGLGGIGLSGSVQVVQTNARNASDLAQWFTYIGIAFAVGPFGGAGSYAWGTNSDGKTIYVRGGGWAYGATAGGSGGRSYTWIVSVTPAVK